MIKYSTNAMWQGGTKLWFDSVSVNNVIWYGM